MPGPITVMDPRGDIAVFGRDRPGEAKPAPSWGEAFEANWNLNQDDELDYQVLYQSEAYKDLEDALVRRGYPRSRYHNPSWNKWYEPTGFGGYEERKRQLIADLVGERAKDPRAFADIPAADQAEFDRWAAGRRGQRQKDQATAARGGTGTAILPGLAFGVLRMGEPENILQIPMGGAGRTFAGTLLRQAGAGAAGTVLTTPSRVLARNQMGEGYSGDELAVDATIGGLAGAGFVAAHGGAVKLGRWANDQLPLDWRLAQQLKREVPASLRTPQQQAAINIVEREFEIDASSPWRMTHEGLDEHASRLQATIDALVDPPAASLAATAPAIAPAPAPAPAAAVPFAGSTNAMLDFVVRDLEGGAQLVTDSGGLTKYGISANANPGVDIVNLTEASAKEIYRRKYIAPLGLEGRPPAVQLVVMDASINHGPEFAKRLLRDHGDNPAAMIAQRRAEYARLIQADPAKYGQYANGWENRLQKIERQIGLRPGEAGSAVPAAAAAIELPVRPAAMDAERPIATTGALELDPAAVEAVQPTVSTRGRSLPTARFRPDEIGVDAELMQFKAGGDQYGVTERLQGITQWDPLAAGMITVWEGADGRRLVADGHQRLGLAKRIMAGNPDAEIEIPAFVLREADGYSALDARVLTALKNIGEGTGSARDAAKVLREAGEAYGGAIDRLPPKSALVRDGKALSRLSDDAFGAAVNEVIPEGYAAAIGHLAPDPATHMALVELLAKLDPANRRQAETIVRQALEVGFARETQEELFGARELTSALFAQKARALDRTLAELRKMKGVFQVAARNADTLEGAGNRIAIDASTAAAEANGRALALIDALALRKGNAVNDIFNRAAERLANGERIDRVVKDVVGELGQLDLDQLARGYEDGAPAGAGGPGDAAGGSGRDGLAAGEDEAAPDSPATLDELEAAGQGGFVFADDTAHQAFDDPAGAGAQRVADDVWHDIDAAAARAAEDKLQAEVAAVHAQAIENQAQLASAGAELAGDGIKFKDPGVKKPERIAEKVKLEGYASAAELKDVARAAFIIDTPEAAERLVAELLRRFPGTFDKGWKLLDSGYFDRKLIVEFANGGKGELQIVPGPVWDAREGGLGDLYQRTRTETDLAVRQQLVEQSAAAYGLALSGSPFEEMAARSAAGNLAAKAAAESGSPSNADLVTSPGASRQVPADQAQARPDLPEVSTATGRSSTSNNSSFTESPPLGDGADTIASAANGQAAGLDLGAAVDPAVADRQRQLAQLGADAPMRGRAEQDGTMGLALFDDADQGGLFDLDDGKGARSITDIKAEIEGDLAGIEAMRSCLL